MRGSTRVGFMQPDRSTNFIRRLDSIVAFLPFFESPDFEFGRWETPRSEKPNVLISPYFSLSDTASKFVQAVYDSGWVDTWAESAEARELTENEVGLQSATSEQLAK